MATTTIELPWDASGAPTLNGTAGSFRNLIRDFLEDCGWSVVWENAGAQKLVMRNSMAHGGSGAYIRVVDTAATTATFRLYESMSNIDTGTAPTTNYTIVKASASGSTPRPYSLIGDQRTFYGTLLGGLTDVPPVELVDYYDYTTFLGGGDLMPAIAGDPGIFATGRTSSGQYNDNNLFQFVFDSGAQNGLSLTRSNALAASTTNAKLMTCSYNAFEIIGRFSTQFGASANPAFTHSILCVGSTENTVIRGKMRGIYLPLHRIALSHKLIGSTVTPVLMATPRTLAVYGIGCVNATYRGCVGIDKGNWDV